MAERASGPRATTAVEVKAQLEAERQGTPFLVYRDAGGDQQILVLDSGRPVWIGRRSSADFVLSWDPEVSTLHAQLEPGGAEWTLVDDGLSRNGSYVNGERVRGRRHLRDRDMLRFGKTVLMYRAPGEEAPESTVLAAEVIAAAKVSNAQRRVLISLCRPFKDAGQFATPATNQQISEELFLSVDAVKTHLRALFEKFEVGDLPQNQKRLALVEKALQSGLISERDL